MPDPASKAVFLSYASQDAEAVERIAEALRDAGTEVWFDKNELTGGDAWDAKIRGQISSCALFVPVISAATQARREGYFRIEWRLAAQRTHAMADGTPFVVPVVIDDTRDAEALVPVEFKAVQWTRLPGGEAPEKFCARVKKLLGVELSPASSRQADGADKMPALPQKNAGRPWLVPSIIGAGLVIAIATYFSLRPHRRPEEVVGVVANTQTVAANPAAKSTPAPAPPGEAQKLIARLWEIHELEQDATPEEWALAEDLGAQAVKLEPNNADAWAAYSVATWGNGIFNHLPSKNDEAQRRASRAASLAPDSFEVRLAVANLERRQANTVDHAERLLRQLVAERPDDKRTLRKLSYTLRDRALRAGVTVMPEEAVKLLDRAAALPGGDASALLAKVGVVERYADAEATIDAALKLRNGPNTLAFKMLLLFQLHGKLDEALALLKQAPSSFWVKPGKTATVAWFWLCHRDPKQALAALAAVQSDFLNGDSFGYEFVGPRSALVGQAHHMAGNVEAAQLDWQAALRVVDQRLLDTANDAELIFWRAWLLASLGRNDEARAVLKIYEQFSGRTGPRIERGTSWRPNLAEIYLKLGERSAVLASLEEREQLLYKEGRTEEAAILRNRLLYDPAWDLLRGDARFEALIARLAQFSAKSEATPAVGGATVTKADDKSIAVLAFANLSDDKANEYFSDGISEELLNVLAKVPGLKVSARTSAFHFKGLNTAIPEIAAQLGVAYVVEGSVRKSGDRVRITAQLIKAADGFHVWSDTFTRELKDVFEMQDEIAGLIAKQLQLTLGAAPRLAKTVDPEAHRLVLEGRFFWNQRSEEGFARAEADFKRALEIDPEFAEAHAGLAGVFAMRSWYRVMAGNASPAMADVARAKEEVRRAKALNPQLAEPSACLGIVLMNELRFEESERQFAEAITLNPNDAIVRHWHSNLLSTEGRLDEAVNEIERSLRLDPLSPNALWAKAYYFGHAGRTQEALDATERALSLRPAHPTILSERALALWKLGRRDEAIATARAVGRDLTAQPRWLADPHAIYVLRLAGLQSEAEAYAERALANVPNDDYRYGTTLVALGRGKEALSYLRTLNSTALISVYWNPMWDSLRDDAQLQPWLVKLGCAEQYKLARETQARMLKEQAAKK